MSEENMAAMYAALSRAQGKVENAKKLSNNPHFKSTYADLATIWDTIRDVFTGEGLAVIQVPCEAAPGHVGLRTVLVHKDGGSDTSTYFVGLKDATNPQQVGSALTYMRRYALLGVAGLGTEDDDGNAATGRPSAPVAVPVVDYSATVAETLKQMEGASETEAKSLYNAIRLGSMQEPAKSALLKTMYETISTKFAKPTEGKKK